MSFIRVETQIFASVLIFNLFHINIVSSCIGGFGVGPSPYNFDITPGFSYRYIELNANDDDDDDFESKLPISTNIFFNQTIHICLSNIPTLPANLCKRFEEFEIREIVLSATNTKNFQDEALQNCVHLQKISCDYNLLTEIDEKMFEFSENIEVITITFNEIQSIHPNAFIHNKKLRTLDLEGNRIKEFTLVSSFVNLRELSLITNSILNLRFEGKMYQGLKVEFLNNPLTCESILEKYEITCEEGTLSNFNETNLTLSHDTSFETSKMKNCIALNKQFYCFRITLSTEDNLKEKYFENEEHKIIDKFALQHSEIPIIPLNICENYSKIKELSFIHTKTLQFEKNALQSCSNLKKIFFSLNFLTKIDENLFKFNENLTFAFLAFNKIEFVHPQAFSNNFQLKFLALSNNKIIKFSITPSLQETTIDLNHNKLNKIYFNVTDENLNNNSSSKLILRIINNQINCDFLNKKNYKNYKHSYLTLKVVHDEKKRSKLNCLDDFVERESLEEYAKGKSIEVFTEDLPLIEEPAEEPLDPNIQKTFQETRVEAQQKLVFRDVEANPKKDNLQEKLEKTIENNFINHTTVEIFSSKIEILPKKICENLNTKFVILSLELSATNTEIFEMGALENCPELRNFTFTLNPMKEIDENMFHFTKKLITLNMANNQIEKIHEFAFKDTRNLRRIDLSGNNLRIFVFNSHLNNVERVDLSYNALEMVYFHSKSNPNLNISLNGNDLTCESLKTEAESDESFDFFCNDDNFKDFKVIRKIDNNQENEEIVPKPNLDEEKKYFCTIFKNDKKICRYQKIHLEVDDNVDDKLQIKGEHEGIINELSMYYSNIHNFSDSICKRFQLYHIDFLRLVSTNTKYFHLGALKDCNNLHHFTCQYNLIQKIDQNLFQFNTELTQISLKRNYIKSIDKFAFEKNTKLKSLFLSDNILVSFIFTPQLKSLQAVSLRNNAIERIKFNFTSNSYLVMDLAKNDLNCSFLREKGTKSLKEKKKINNFYEFKCFDDQTEIKVRGRSENLFGLKLVKEAKSYKMSKRDFIFYLGIYILIIILNTVISSVLWKVYKNLMTKLENYVERIKEPEFVILETDQEEIYESLL